MTQQRATFTRREVERSFRKFRDLADDLLDAKFQTWGDSFDRLIAHCETDVVMQVITESLRTDPRVNADQWWTDAVKSIRGMIGSGHYTLPADDDERTALLYQVFLKLGREDINISEFCIAVYGHTKYQDMIDTFNRELVHKFTREVSYRLDEILNDTAEQQEIVRDAMVVFHHHDYSTNIAGNVQAGNIATGRARINAISYVTQHIDATARDKLNEALVAVEEALARIDALPTHPKTEVMAIVRETKEEVAKAEPNTTKIQSLLNTTATAIQTVASLKPAYELLRNAVAYLGITLP